MKRQTLMRLLAVMMVAAVAAGCQTQAKFRERVTHIKTVALLPPQVRTGTMTIGGKLREPFKQESAVGEQIVASLAQEFSRLGFTVTNCDMCHVAGCTNALWNSETIAVLTNAYFSAMAKSVRPEGPELAAHVQADGLVFITVLAYRSTDGRKAFVAFGNFLSLVSAAGGHPGPWTPFSQMIVQISFVDGRSGDVLWRTIADFHDIDRFSGDHIGFELMKKFPKL